MLCDLIPPFNANGFTNLPPTSTYQIDARRPAASLGWSQRGLVGQNEGSPSRERMREL